MTDYKIIRFGGPLIGGAALGSAIGGYLGAAIGAVLAFAIVYWDLKREVQ